jgi:cobalt-zinc-cadmium resistance protein CzcA
VLVTEPVGGLLARAYRYQFQRYVHARVGLMGVAVQNSVIQYSLHQQVAAGGKDDPGGDPGSLGASPAAHPMTALVACFGLLPAAMSTGIGSDSQKPFAIVIVGGLASRLLLSIFLSPALYALVARDGDTLQV